jgi:hypothetical protein
VGGIATAAGTRERVLALFERHRQRPGTPFDESQFLDHLLAQPKRVGAFRDSFAGLRRYNAFIDAAQLEFTVCFSNKDRERNYTLDGFVQRTEALAASRKSSLASLRHQIERGFGAQLLIVADVMLFPVVAVAWRHPLALGAAIALVLLVNAGFGLLYWRFRRYNARLLRQLQEASR